MKNSFIFVASVLAIALASCTEVLPEKEASDSGMNKIVFGIASEAITKTALLDESGNPDPDGDSPYWQKGDQILLEGDDGFPQEIYTLGNIGDSMHNEKEYECATYFNGDSPFYGVYPYSSYVSRSGSSIMMNIPNQQSGNFKDAHFCAAQSYCNNSNQNYVRTYHLDFYPVAPILHFKKSDFQTYPHGNNILTITGDLDGQWITEVDDKEAHKGEKESNIVGDISVEFDMEGKVIQSTSVDNGKAFKSITVNFNENTPDDIYIALWPGVNTSDILFIYSYSQYSTVVDIKSKPVADVVLQCNTIYPAFFGRRVSTIEKLNEFLGDGTTESNAHYLVTKPASGTVIFTGGNAGNMIGLDFSSDISNDQTINFDVASGVERGPSELIIVASKGKNTTFTFDDVLLKNTTKITVNGVQVTSKSHVLK